LSSASLPLAGSWYMLSSFNGRTPAANRALGALAAFPVGKTSLPGLRLAGCRQLAPSSDIPAGGRVLGQATFPGSERALALSVTDSLRHLHVIGPTGVGKSTLLTGLIAQDMAAGRGVAVIDPKGDLARDVLDQVPASRVGDVIILDPADEERPVGLNLLAGTAESRELVVDQVVGIFHSLYSAFWGPRTDDILWAALLTLVGVPGMTLAEVPLLLSDPGFRRRLVAGAILREPWATLLAEDFQRDMIHNTAHPGRDLVGQGSKMTALVRSAGLEPATS